MTFHLNDPIIEEGRLNDEFYILISGKVAASLEGKQLYSLKRQGDLVGEASIINKVASFATFKAEEECEMLKISSKHFKNYNNFNQDIFESLLYRVFTISLSDKLILNASKLKARIEDLEHYQSSPQNQAQPASGNFPPSKDSLEALHQENQLLKEKLEKKRKQETELAEQVKAFAIADAVNSHQKDILSSILGNLGEAVVVLDKNLKITHSNASTKTLLEVDEIEPEIRLWPATYNLSLDKSSVCDFKSLPIQQALENQEESTSEIYVLMQNQTKSIKLSISLFRPLGSFEGLILVLSDVTALK